MSQSVVSNVCIFAGLLLFSFFLSVTGTGAIAHAQSSLDGNLGVHLVPNPQFPGPHSRVEISLDAYSLETTGATITWYINNVVQKNFQNERSLVLQTGDIGEKSVIRVTLSRNAAPTLSSSITLIPALVDIILESKTYTPTFYRGRALPSTESNLRVVAVVNDGSNLPESAYTYTWTQGRTVLFGGPVKGKNILDIQMPHYADERLAVEVFDPNGVTIGMRAIPLTTSEPELHFYEHSPLRGLSEKELLSPFTLISEETTIYGEPYYTNAAIDESLADFVWKINGESTTHDTNIPNAITLRHIGGEGNATIDFQMVTKTSIPQFVEKTFQLFFK